MQKKKKTGRGKNLFTALYVTKYLNFFFYLTISEGMSNHIWRAVVGITGVECHKKLQFLTQSRWLRQIYVNLLLKG